jgi:hypothetical protein
MTTTTVALAPVRRWILRTQSAHRERGATAGNIYFTVLFIAVVGGILHRQLAVVFWPTAPNASGLAAVSLVAILFGLLYLALRRFGPLALSRPAASWLMQAPVSRRRLLLPSLRLAVIVAAIVAVLESIAIIGHSAPRSLPGEVLALLGIGAGLAGVALLLIALAAQAGGRWGDAVDGVISLVLAAGFIGLVTATARDESLATTGWPGTSVLGPVVGALALVVVVLLAFAVRGLARTPNDRILEASKTAGTLFDAAFGMEPSFVTDMVERRFWARRKLRSTHLVSRLPALVAQDLMLVLRRRRRLLWLALATTLPVLISGAPNWLIGVVILIGLLPAGSTATGNVKTDAGNPVLLRSLGVTSRQAILQRMVLPGVLGGVWAAVALSVLRGLGELPPGPWWALGLVLGPVGAAAAVHRARVGFVRNELLPLDTPMGTVSPGPLVNLVIGPDMLLLGLPTLVEIAQGHPLTWLSVVTQAVVGVIGARAYLSGSTSPDRVELKKV